MKKGKKTQMNLLKITLRNKSFKHSAFSWFDLCQLFFTITILLVITCSFPKGSYAQNDEDLIRIKTELVPFEVTVTDKNGNPVRGLKAEDFKIFEEDVERPVDFFEPIKKRDEDRPLSVVFALDVSGSITTEELEKLRDAMRSFVKRLADYNSYFAGDDLWNERQKTPILYKQTG